MKCVAYYFSALLLIILFKSVLNICEPPWVEQRENASYPVLSVVYKRPDANECGCVSNNITKNYFCVRKCCQKNYILKDYTCVFDENNTFTEYPIPIYFNKKDVAVRNLNEMNILSGMIACKGNKSVEFATYRVSDVFPEDAVITKKDGKLWIIEENWYYNYDRYCIEYSEEYKASAYICELEYVEDLNFGDRLSFIGTMISLPFLLVTFVVYAVIPQRSLHGTCLMCYVFVLFMAYFLLSFSYFYTGEITFTTCRVMGMVTLFCFISSIFWMNVMSYDMYSKFKGSRGFSVSNKSKRRKRFALYSAYAWGVPLLLIILIITLSRTVKPNVWYDPGIRGEECFLRDGIPELLYFYGPLAILITANIVMFIMTAIRIKKLQNDTKMLTRKGSKKHSSKGDDQYRFSLYIKLLFAMGINWSVEIISWILNWQVQNVPPAVWYLTDFCNAAYGVVIFFIFVFKKSIWKLLKKRYYMITGKTPLETTETTTINTTSKP
ncbi:hypothetical protein ILUMI_06614 [Ignelater luminosus]|uniref:G-protein coupled receptors family 2 profile 2 domain-containing protein n=1 Tax=Ignelater luminosus TaxID=2038154 RepID=A0A8K0GH21_IGNLU|nr:hypothetical protein ILUMI_06614 [Ignelater luminosus]